MNKRSVAGEIKHRRKGIHPKKLRAIDEAIRQYESACETLWDDMIFGLCLRLKLRESTIERIVGVL